MGEKLNSENFNSGLLVDDELIGGVTQDPKDPEKYIAYVLRHVTGEYLGYQAGLDRDEALHLLNQVERAWKFESTSACQGCGKQDAGTCNGQKCAIKKSQRRQDTKSSVCC